MKFTFFRLILFSAIIGFLSSCLGTSSTTTVSSSPYFSSLVFKTNDSIPFLNSAVFTLGDYDAVLKDSIIINVDSLPYSTRIDSVYPTFSFKSSAGAKLYFPVGYKYKKDSAWITGTDTVDFRKPIRIRNFATDGKTYKDYIIKTNVHSIDPEAYIWSKASGNLNSINSTSQKAITRNDTLFYYQNDGTNSYLNISTNGYTWSSVSVTGLPANTPLTDMTQFNGRFFVSRDGFNLYSSTDGITWIKKSLTDFSFKSLLFALNGKMWAVVQSNTDSSLRFANSTDGDIWTMIGTIPANFPVSDFASVSFASPTGKPEALVIAGLSSTGALLNNRWSTEDGAYWIDFSTENHTLDTLAIGASVISYDNKLFAFGLRTDNGKSYFKVSKDEGLSWQIPDIKRNVLSSDYLANPRSYQSAVVFKPKTYDKINSAALKDEIQKSNRIFVIGGKMGSVSLSDVWTGKLNKKNFLRQ